MKKLLLILAIFFIAQTASAQVSAFQPPNIHQCDSQVFDLTVTIPAIIGAQNPDNLTLTFHHSSFDALEGINPIANPESYVSPEMDDVFARVESNFDSTDFATTGFTISWESVGVPQLADITTCLSYVLPPISAGNYFTGLFGTGTQLFPGDVITQTMTIYIYFQPFQFGCFGQTWFTVYITTPPTTLTDFVICETNGNGVATFDLTTKIAEATGGNASAVVTFHETLFDAQMGANPIANPATYQNTMSPQTLYIRYLVDGVNCVFVASFNLIVTTCSGNTVSGIVRFDADGNGCTTDDEPMPNFQVTMTTGNSIQYAFTDAQGNYVFNDVEPGVSVIWASGISQGMTPFPTATTLTMGQSGDSQTVNFCVTGPEEFDGAIFLVANTAARPGFAAQYTLVVQNLGSAAIDGQVSLVFDDVRLNYINSVPTATQTDNVLTFGIASLSPFQNLQIPVSFMVEIPPTAMAGHQLQFSAAFSVNQADAVSINNTYDTTQTLVDSYDPNDKTVNEAGFQASNTESYLHYLVRFQNTGTADAINVRIEDQLDENLNWSTFRPIASSHPNSVSMDADGKITFSFPNVNLPAEQDDEPGSHGYVLYKVKLKSGLNVNNDIYNTAYIYFDFNEAIVTNTVMTDLGELLAVSGSDKKVFALYPNPAKENVSVSFDGPSAAVSVTDIQGKKVVETIVAPYQPIDVSSLGSGLYFVRISADGKSEVKKLIVR